MNTVEPRLTEVIFVPSCLDKIEIIEYMKKIVFE